MAHSSSTLPWSWYRDLAILEAERDRIFSRAWQYVGHTGLVEAPGSYATVELGRVPVVVARDRQGELHALVNVCRHRGAVLCEGTGHSTALRCPYHAWTYELDGALRRAPRSDREPAFRPDDHSLAALPIGTWGPWIFVSPDPGAPPLQEALGTIPQRVAELVEVDELVFLERAHADYRANWKVCVENFLECYHCRVAHPGFAGVIDTDPDDYRLVTEPTGSSQYGPVRTGWTGAFDPRGPIGRSQFHLVHPNLTVNIMPGHPNLSIGPVVPTGPGTTHRFLDYFVGPDVDAAWIEDFRAFDDQVGREDLALVESVQRGMDAGIHDHGTLFLDSEQLIAHFASYVRSALV